jgi:hypothetical protein
LLITTARGFATGHEAKHPVPRASIAYTLVTRRTLSNNRIAVAFAVELARRNPDSYQS